MSYSTKKFLDSAGTGYLWSKIKAELDKKSDSTVIEAKVKANADAIAAIKDGADIDSFKDVEDALALKQDTIPENTYAAFAYEAKVDALVGADTGKSARTIASEELATQLIPENAKESLDTLQEIANWIQSHPDDAASMASDIAALQDILADFGTSDHAVAATVREYVDDAVAALKIGDYAKAADLTAAVQRIAALEAKPAAGITAEQIAAWTAKQDAIPAGTYDAYGEAEAVYDAMVALEPADIDAAIAKANATA